MSEAGARDDFLNATLGRTGRRVFRLGLSGSYFPGVAALRHGIDAGMNYVFAYPWDFHTARAIRELPAAEREKLVVATGVGNLGWAARRALEGALRRLRTDWIDVFQIYFVGNGKLRPRTLELLRRFQEQGKVRHIAISTHHRGYAGALVREGALDVLMMRYNAAHRGAEREIFPHLEASRPGVVSYTATRWGKLLRRPKGWTGRAPSAGDCYRFVLGNPHVHVCLTAPRNRAELDENLAAVRRGPLCGEEMEWMRRFGDAVRAESRFFL
jgi:aryl-alcohol dehydrogenase-like predicted oxidoreductase